MLGNFGGNVTVPVGEGKARCTPSLGFSSQISKSRWERKLWFSGLQALEEGPENKNSAWITSNDPKQGEHSTKSRNIRPWRTFEGAPIFKRSCRGNRKEIQNCSRLKSVRTELRWVRRGPWLGPMAYCMRTPERKHSSSCSHCLYTHENKAGFEGKRKEIDIY